MWVVIVGGLLFFILGLGVVVFVIVFLMKSNKKELTKDVVIVRGEVVLSIPGKGYRMKFRTDNKETIILNVNAKDYYRLLSGFYGDITYRGDRLLSFDRLEKHEEMRLIRKMEDGYFFQLDDKKSDVVFSCSAPSLDVEIHSTSPINVSLNEVLKYVDRLYENTEENLFGLEKKDKIIQFSNSGYSKHITVDVPIKGRDATNQAQVNDLETVKKLVVAFFNNEDVRLIVDFEVFEY